mmetsp:Transcript_85696/g.223340  ORF Transcript_85696/g.223340 Transcript_85696/m.223340 type:complete len:95 (-) Transcript_85696:546-830(-)
MTGTPEAANNFRVRTTVYALKASKPLNGSSKNNILGLDTSSTPMETRFCSPPERPLRMAEPTQVSAQPSKCKADSMPSTYASRCVAASVGGKRK